MSDIGELEKVKSIVLSVLKEDEDSRSNDNRLILKVVEICAMKNGFDISNMFFAGVINNKDILGLPSFETITRCRRKIQEEFPELQGTEKVERHRAYREMVVRKAML